MTTTFTTTRRIEFHETDLAGIVHFSNFYKYMEQAEHEYFRSLGLSISMHQDDGTIMGWPRVSASSSFEAPAFFEDVVEIKLYVVRVGVKSLNMEFEFFRENLRLARGRMKTVCCTFKRGDKMRSIEIPEEIRSRFVEVDSPLNKPGSGRGNDHA